MDIRLNRQGDICFSPEGDFVLVESIAQKIQIRLKWFLGEWRWNKKEGLPYFESLLIKNPNTDYFESLIRTKIFEIDEIVDVKDVSIFFDNKTRDAIIKYVAYTDQDKVAGEVALKCQISE